jgi:tetratricopeptide (TPR) repeat protein
MRYKSSPKGASEIGRELSAGTLIEGSVRKAGDRVRITVQIVDANTEGHVWAKSYDKQLDDIFAIQSEIAEKVTEELRVQLLESEKRKLEAKPTEDTNAYTSYLKARFHWNSRSEEGLATAIRYFEDAVRRDPGYTLALVGLGDAYSVSSIFGYIRPITGYLRAKELVQKAVAANPDSAEAHASMGEILMQSSYDWLTAARELDRALQINPNYAVAHVWRSSWYQVHGQVDKAIAEGRQAQELEPFAVVVLNEIAKTYYYARRYDEAIEHFVRSIEVEPDSAYLRLGLAETYAQTHMFEDAVQEVEKALGLSRNAYVLDGAASVYAVANERTKARNVLLELDDLAKIKFVPFYGRAGAYAALGDKENALQLLESAYREHSWLVWVGVDPMFDSLKSEQTFHNLLRKMNLESTNGATHSVN